MRPTRLSGLLASLLAASVPLVTAACAPAANRPQRSPRTDLAQACSGREGWSDPAPPAQVAGNVWYVGTCGITALLVTSSAGHVLMDGATAQAASAILASIRAAGFDPRDVRWIVSSHPHNDHVGALAALKAATGARVAAGREAKLALEAGQVTSDDPQAAIHEAFPPIRVDRVLGDGEVLAVGDLQLTMHETPVHSPGSASWTWKTAGVTMTFADSMTTISADDYHFADHPARVAAIRAGLDAAAALPCGLLITPHPSASDLFERLAGRAKLADSAACRAYAEAARTRFEQRLAREMESRP